MLRASTHAVQSRLIAACTLGFLPRNNSSAFPDFITGMRTGKVISYDPEKGEGTIQPDGEDDTIPFYTESFADPALKDHLREGDRVRFGVVGGMAGLMCTHLERVDG